MNRTAARLTKILVVPVVLASAATVSACAPVITQRSYSASDGVAANLGAVRGINLMVISGGQGEPGRLLGAFTNAGDQSVTVTVTPQGTTPATIPVDGSATTLLGTQSNQTDIVFPTTDAIPGALLPITITVDGQSKDLSIPVLDGTQSQYAPLVPTAPAG